MTRKDTATMSAIIGRVSGKVFLSLCFCVSVLTANAVATQDSAIDKLIAKQKKIKTLSADFTQEKHSTMLKDPLISEGLFYFMAPDKVAWIYTGQIKLVSDGKNLTVYYPELKEAEIVPVKKSLIRLPLNFDLSEFRRYFNLGLEKKKGLYRVTLTPIDKASLLRTMIITFSGEGAPVSAEMFEKGGDRSVIKFKNHRINKRLSEKLFHITLPKDTTIRRFQQ